MKTNNVVAAFLAILAAAATLSANEEMDLDKSLLAALDQARSAMEIEGAAAAIIFPDGEAWVGAVGMSDPRNAVDPLTVFETGSMSQMFLGALALALAREGKLDLDGEAAPDSLAHLIEGATTIPVEIQLTERYLKPLTLIHTSWHAVTDSTPAGVRSSAHDMALWTRALVDDNALGPGAMAVTLDDHDLVGHGNTTGPSGATWHATRDALTVTVLTNHKDGDVTSIVEALLRVARAARPEHGE